jgi:hypothetical protein
MYKYAYNIPIKMSPIKIIDMFLYMQQIFCTLKPRQIDFIIHLSHAEYLKNIQKIYSKQNMKAYRKYKFLLV